MRKATLIFSIAVGLLFILFLVARTTGILQYSKTVSEANFPSINVGEHHFISSLKKPKRFDFICFKRDDSIMGNGLYIYRLCGKGGDLVEIRNGVLFVNKRNADAALKLAHNYYTDLATFTDLRNKGLVLNRQVSEKGGLVVAILSDEAVHKGKFFAQREVLSKDFADPVIEAMYGQAWNLDHFGPIRIPQGFYFVLGDNRHNAADSRYLGLVNEADFAGTILNK